MGLTLWFAAGAFVLALIAFALDWASVALVLVLLTLMWGIQGVTRALRIHRHVQARRA